MFSYKKNKTIKYILAYGLFYCFLLLPSTLLAKQELFNFTNIGDDEGLYTTVISLLLDKQGFIWLGTQTGLYRYDGYDFIKHQHDPDDPSTLANNYVQTLFEDNTGTLWVGTAGGVLHQYQAQFDKFTRYTFDKDYPKTSRSTSVITSIAQESDTGLWVSSLGGGLSRFDLLSKQFTNNFSHQIDNDNSLSDDNAYTVLQDSTGLVWVGTRDGGLNVLNPETGNFTRYLHQPDNPKSLSHNKVYKLLEDSKGILWIATRGGGLNRFNANDETFTRYQSTPDNPESISSNIIFSLHEDIAGTLWIGTYSKGLNRFNPDTQSFSRYLNDPLNMNSLSSDNIWAITQDDTGNILLGTFGAGLSHFNPDSSRFGLNMHQADHANGLSAGRIHAIYKDRSGILWVGSTAGLDRYDEEKNQWYHYQAEAELEKKLAVETSPLVSNKLSHNDVWAIFEDSYGHLWVGTRNGGLNLVERSEKNNEPLLPENYSFIHYKKSSNNIKSLSDDVILTLDEDSSGQLWVGTQNGLNRFDRQQNNFTRFLHDKDQPNSLSGNIIRSVFTDKQGRLWVGTQGGGLNLYNDKNDIPSSKSSIKPNFVRFQHDPEDKNSLSSNTIYSIDQDSQGILWLGTTVGINRFNPETKTFNHLRMVDGLPSDAVSHVMIDQADNIWLNYTLGGISLLDHETIDQPGKLSILNNVGGEADCKATQGASFKDQNGKLYWGSANQYCAFYPEQVIKQSQIPTIAITDFKLLNKSVAVSQKNMPSPLNQAINQTTNITLGYEDNILSFEFAALHFTNSKANRYQYKLEGFNKEWIETDWKNRHATYTNLPAGNYTFTIKASNNEGQWNEKGRSIQLTILPPPWQTWWAYTLYGVFILSLIYLFVRAQWKKVNFERQLNAQLENKVLERTVALQSSNESLETVNNQLEKVNDQLEELSLTDQLTGLRNRRFLVNNLENDINLILRRYKKASLKNATESLKESDLIFFLIDLDHFKQVNDIHGHSAGDTVLIQIKAILASVFRETDYLVRWGGEEFLAVARFTEREYAPELAERLRAQVEDHSFDTGQGHFLNKTCSIGYASYPFIKDQPDYLDWERVIDIADHCLYTAKKSNRNAWVGLDNMNCTGENVFTNITENTQELLNLRKIKANSSLSHELLLKWD